MSRLSVVLIALALASPSVLLVAACDDTATDGGSSGTDTTSEGEEEPDAVTVADVTGRDAKAARKKLRRQGFDVELVRRYSDSTERGTVARQRPEGGEEGSSGDLVKLVVSKGPKPPPEPGPPPPEEPPPDETTEEGDCDPSYPDVCIPSPPPDLDCPEVDETNFSVQGSDPHGFDADSDGVGCES